MIPDDRPYSRLAVLSHLPLGRKVALIPMLTVALMVLMLALSVQMGVRNTAALRALDDDVFEPLNQAQTLKDGITLLHGRLFALLSVGNNETNPAAQSTAASGLVERLDTEVANVNAFLARNQSVAPDPTDRLRHDFAAYAARVRETAGFAAYDASYGALLAAGTDEAFGHLSTDLDVLVDTLSHRRAALVSAAVTASLNARAILFSLGLGAALLALLGSVLVGRSIARPLLRLTALMNRMARGDTDHIVLGAERRDEVGAMARAVEVFRANVIARHEIEVALRRTNLQFDAALNSMLQGMLVWGVDHRVQLVNRRFFAICGVPADSITPGMSVAEVIDVTASHGLFPDQDKAAIANRISTLLTARRSMQVELQMRPNLLVQVASMLMANGGAVITLEDVTEKRRNEAQIAFMAHHDALTSLPNRARLREHLDAAVARLGDGRAFAVLYLDLDHFKDVNDTLGHAAGDGLLQLVADRLRRCVRDGDVTARLGGDEFAIVLECPSGDAAPAVSLAARVVDSIALPFDVQGHTIVIGASIGIALSELGATGAELMKRADMALYRAKEERGTFAIFEPGMDEDLHARRGLEADLRLAIQREEFELHYQPLYNFIEDRISVVEALLRWNSPTRGRVPPSDFIPLAEQSGMIAPIGEWVLRTACAQAAAWPSHVRVAINLSPVQFKNPQLVGMVREILAATGLPAQRLELEITETVLLRDTEAVMTMLHGLHDMGVRICMDDFGTGYSSLSYLQRFPFDKIKIDRSFVSDLRAPDADGDAPDALSAASKSAALIVRAITGLGENLGISTTAEGVETLHQFAQTRREGCTEVQGYFISPPKPAAEVEQLIRHLDITLPAISGGRDMSPRRVA